MNISKWLGKLKRNVAGLLVAVMVFSVLPVTPANHVHAQEAEETAAQTQGTSVEQEPLHQTITVTPGQLLPESGEIVENEIYGYVVGYELKKGHVLSISDTDYVFSVRKLADGDYSTMLKQATADSFTATEDMTVGMLIRKPDKSALTAEELAGVTIVDTLFAMENVSGSVHRFTVEAETIDGGTATTRAAIFLPESYSDAGEATRLIIMTNGLHAYLTDSVWNANTDDDVGVMKHYMENGYAVLIVNNTADRVNGAPDWGNPQLVSSYWKAYEYVQAHLNVEELFSIHSRSMGTFAAIRLMREHPELVKCAVMCGPVLSLRSRFSTGPAHIAKRYGFDDLSGATWEADKVVGYDPYTDVNGLEYDLPPTFWMLAESDATSAHLATIEKIAGHGNDVTQALYTDTDHSGVCRLNTDACKVDSLAFLEKYQESTSEHRFCAWQTVSDATCTAAGEMRRECADCSYYESMEIPALDGHVFENNETVCDTCGMRFDKLCTELTAIPGQFNNSTGEWVDSDIYGCVIGYELKAGHILSISDENYVFSVRVLQDGNYSTMLKEATADSFTAEEDMVIAVRVRKPDKSAITEEELAGIVLYDTCYAEHSHTYENGICTGCGAQEPRESMSLRYDDHVDMTGKTVETVDAGTPTSCKVGYGVAEGTPDDAVITLDGDTLIATGIGTAFVRIDGKLYEITVEAAPISLLLLIGQSNMQGSEGNADQSIVCPDGMVYSTYGDRYTMTVSNATNFAPSALTGEGSAINVNGTTTNLEDWPVYLLNEAGDGKIGPDSGFAYEWVQQTGEKVWVVNAAHGGTNISAWQDSGTQYEECVLLFQACLQTLHKEIDAGHFTLSHMGYFWCQGCANYSNTAEWYVEKYLTMHNNLKTELAFSEDVTFEFGGIIPVRAGHESYTSYRQGVYADTTTAAYHESFKDLRFTGPRVAQYWMINNPELPDIWGVCNIGEDWVWMSDGTNGVTEYFQSHYENGTVDYTTQVQQSAGWYTPTTPKAVHDSIHYNQIGYNEVGRESARNALILLGEIEAPEVETTVELLTWDGYTAADTVSASTAGSSATLVVPKVYPLWKSKEVTYTLSEGLHWDYYDLLADTADTEGTLTAVGAAGTVTVEKSEPCLYFAEHLCELPEAVCAGLNLWSLLEHDEYYYSNGTGWGIHSSGTVRSVTIPVEPGDLIYASAFGAAGTNGSTSTSGIRLTFFGEYAVVRTMAPSEVYPEFTANGGYLVVPEGTVAVNVAMWTDSDEWELYILNREHDTTDPVCSICGNSSHTHEWSEWETVTEPSMDGPGVEQRTCSGCGEVENREVEGVWTTLDLSDHLNSMPESYCAGTNLWPLLEHDKYFYSGGTRWAVHSSGTVYSVTIPVAEGDRIYATSFGKTGENGNTGSTSGIRVTFFDAYGVALTMTPAETYAVYTTNGGYLIAPEGAVAVNIPMWNNSESNELYILNREHIPAEAVRENEGTGGSYESVVYCTGCGGELSRETVTSYTPGDINGDGEVNNKDLTRLFRYLTGYDVEVVEAALDVNGDGSVNNKDQTRLFRYLSGWDVDVF